MRLLALLIALAASTGSVASQPVLSLTAGGNTRHYSAAALLGRRDAVSITVPNDVSYLRSMTYRAVPLLALLPPTHQGATDFPGDRADTLEAKASDGFIAQIPLELVSRGSRGGAVAYLAVEDPANPWPALPSQTHSAGPFYLIWQDPQRSAVSREQWPFALVSLELAESPLHRWPELAAPASDPAAGAGQNVFVTFCLPCHQLNGAGAGHVGPDLGRPMPATRYLTESGLRALVRNPAGVRTWPQQHMAGFDTKTLPDAELDALVVYLKAMAR